MSEGEPSLSTRIVEYDVLVALPSIACGRNTDDSPKYVYFRAVNVCHRGREALQRRGFCAFICKEVRLSDESVRHAPAFTPA